MKRITILLTACLIGLSIILFTPAPKGVSIPFHEFDPLGRPYDAIPVWHSDYITTFTQEYESNAPEPALETLQCPIPMECRVRNYTGTQCVFASTEMLARWAECKELLEPEPLTSRPGCRSYSGPSDLSNKLRNFGVKFEQTYRDREAGIRLIKKAMAEGRGCLWGVPGHAMVLVHYDEQEDRVCWVDNSDRSLRVQTTTVSNFKRRWDSWICVIYANPDIVPYKIFGPHKIPIEDHNDPRHRWPDEISPDYFPRPI